MTYFNKFHYLKHYLEKYSHLSHQKSYNLEQCFTFYLSQSDYLVNKLCFAQTDYTLSNSGFEMVSWDKKYHIEVRKSIAILAFLLSLCIIHGTDTSLLQYSINFLFKNNRTHILIFTKIILLFFNMYHIFFSSQFNHRGK